MKTFNIVQYNDKKEKEQSFECVLNPEYYQWGWYGYNNKEAVDNMKRLVGWLIEDLKNIDYDELYKYNWEWKRILNINK